MKYRFWIETKTGQVVEWLGLSEQQAKRLSTLTGKTIVWSGITRFGWEIVT